MISRLVGVALAILASIWLAAQGHAQQTQNELRDTARLVVSERLRTFALAHGLEPEVEGIGIAQDLKALLIRQGFYLDEGASALLLRRQSIYPLLTYDSNLNGGVENGTLTLGGLVLSVNEDQLAQGGLAAGAGYDGAVRLGWSQGRYIEGQVGLEAIHAHRPGLTQTDRQVSICARNHVGGWSFADLCLEEIRVDRTLSDYVSREAEFSLAHLFEGAGGSHEVTLSAGRVFESDIEQNFVSLRLDSVGRSVATRHLLRMAEPSFHGDGPEIDAKTEMRWNMDGRIAGMALSASRTPGAPFLGQQRWDVGLGISGLYQLHRNALLTVGFNRRNSTVDFFDTDTFRVRVSFALP